MDTQSIEDTIQDLRRQLAEKDATIQELEETVEDLECDIRNCKEFFGYESEMDINDMKQYKEECEDEERESRAIDQEYDKQCKRVERMSDLVIELGELQFDLSDVKKTIKTLGTNPEEIIAKRKKFNEGFNELKNFIPEDKKSSFLELMVKWMTLEKRMFQVDSELNNI